MLVSGLDDESTLGQIDGETPMREFVARENIKRFEAQIAACTDPAQSKVLTRLLDEEREKLKEIRAEKIDLSATSQKTGS
jgi:rubrerythrin